MDTFDPPDPIAQPPKPPETPEPPEPTPQTITEPMVAALRGTGPWLRFFSIMGMLMMGFMVAVGAVMFVAGIAGLSTDAGSEGGVVMIGLGVLYVVLALLYIAPTIFLFKAAGGVVELKSGEIAGGMEKALVNQKKFWKYIGIFTIAFMVLYPILIGVFLVIGLVGGSMMG